MQEEACTWGLGLMGNSASEDETGGTTGPAPPKALLIGQAWQVHLSGSVLQNEGVRSPVVFGPVWKGTRGQGTE